MTQQEFDARMEQLNKEQAAESLPHRIHLEALNARMEEVRIEVSEKQLQLAKICAERQKVELTIKNINRKYHDLKHEAVLQAPHKQMQKCPLAEALSDEKENVNSEE